MDATGQLGSAYEATATAYAVNANYGNDIYCLSCCSANRPIRQVDESWQLMCAVTAKEAAVDANQFGREFRFLRNYKPGDQTVVWCPLPRSACVYTSDGSLAQECYKDTSFLASYTLHLDLYMKTNGFQSWRYVKSCSATTVETQGLPFYVNETIYMKQDDYTWHPAALQLLWLILVFFLLISGLVRCLRNDRCLVCNKLLIYFREMCWLCRFYGCERPDPNVIARLRERDAKIRGKDFRLIENEGLDRWQGKVIQWWRRRWKAVQQRLKVCHRRVYPSRRLVPNVQPRARDNDIIAVGGLSSSFSSPSAPSSSAALGDLIEIFHPGARHWALAQVLSSTEVPPEGYLVPEVVANFIPTDPSIQNLADGPHGYIRLRIAFASGPRRGEDMMEAVPEQHHLTVHSAHQQQQHSQQEEEKKEEATEQGGDVFVLANYGCYGLLYDIQTAQINLWRFSTSHPCRQQVWPPSLCRAFIPANDNLDLHQVAQAHRIYYHPHHHRDSRRHSHPQGAAALV